MQACVHSKPGLPILVHAHMRCKCERMLTIAASVDDFMIRV